MGEADDIVSEVTGSSATVREGAGASRRARADILLPEGTPLGRYIVQGVLGRGGMGVVYAAFDPELGRKVAVKLLQARGLGSARGPSDPRGSTTGDQAWLVREAQALARLAHPNVVAVHDVGTLTGDRVFVAMEHVEGDTLRAWLRGGNRTWREIVAALRGAGAGLAAAHAAGLVHRDVKPDNMLVGRDGRVRMMDFGLARDGVTAAGPSAAGSPATDETPPPRTSDHAIDTRTPLPSNLTVAGEVLGTPAYMAPEVHEGQPADARADQFAFGVTLYEALYDQRPYTKSQLQWPRAEPPVATAPPAGAVPQSIQRVAMRAIAADPDARYASMDELLDDLVVGMSRSRARTALLVVAGAVVLAGTAITVSVVRGQRPGVAAPCAGVEQRLQGVWDETIKRSVLLAFTDSHRAYAAATYAGLARALDGYAGEWTAVATESCRATRVRRDQTEAVLSLRQACLDQRLEELRALTGMLAKADGALVDKADQAAWKLDPVIRCSNVTALTAPGQPSADATPLLAPIARQLAQGRAELAVGKFDAALVAARAAAAAAVAVGFDPVTAEAQLLIGEVLAQSGKPAEARDALQEATFTAVRGKRDDVAAEAALFAARVSAEGLGDAHESAIWLGLGSAALARMGGDRALELTRLESEGIVAAARGDLRAAVDAHQRGLVAAEELLGHDDPALWHPVQTLAATLAKSGSYAAATPYYERALTLREAAVGPAHPDVALVLTSLGACYDHAGQPVRARTSLERALSIRERAFGKTSPRLIATLNNMADLLREQGDLGAALAAIQRAKAIAATVPGTSHPLYHTVCTTLGQVLSASGKEADARLELDAAIALEELANSPVLPTTLTARAAIELGAHAWIVAAGFDERAIAAFEAAGGASNPELWRPLADLAVARRELGRTVDARALVDRAIHIGEGARLADADLAGLHALADGLPPTVAAP